MRDLIDQDPDVSGERAVFAFQAPPYEDHPLGHVGSDGRSGARAAVTLPKLSDLNSDSRKATSDSRGPFEATHNGSVQFRDNNFAVLRTPFSTPGPRCAISRAPAARYPWEGNPILSHTTDNGFQEAMDVPPPFSTPGPFVSPRPASGHIFGSHAVAPHMLPDEVYPTIQKSSAVPVLSSYTTRSDGIDTPLFPVQDGCEQFSALPNIMQGFALKNSGGLLLRLPVPSGPHIHSLTEGLSSSPTLATDPTFPGDRGIITPSPGLTRLSPGELIGRSAVNGNTAYDDVSVLNSDDLLGQKAPFCAFSLSGFPISPKHSAESSPSHRRNMTTPDTYPRTPMAPPQSMPRGTLPTNFDWVSPDAQSPENSGSIDQLDIADVNAYTPVTVVSELMRETSGIFAPTPDIFLSPLLESDAPDSRAHIGSTANGSAQGISEVVSWRKRSIGSLRDFFE